MGARIVGRTALAGIILAYGGGYVLHRLHAGQHEAHDINPALHWLRDSSLSLPSTLVVVALASVVARAIVLELGLGGRLGWTRVTWALVAAVGYALASIPGNIAHAWLFGAEHEGQGALEHAMNDASAALGASLVVLLAVVCLVGAPRERTTPLLAVLAAVRGRGTRASVHHAWTAILEGSGARALPALLPAVVLIGCAVALAPRVGPADAATAAETGCAGFAGTRTIEADVVALEQPFFYNRLGVRAGAPEDPYGLMYALRRDVVVKSGPQAGEPIPADAALFKGNVELRAGKRPRPLVLRMNVGDCLVVHFQNLLGSSPKPDHPADRHVGIHVNGLQMAKVGALSGIGSDGSFVGENESSLVGPGGKHDYALFAEYENTYLMYSMGTPVGGEGLNASIALGLFGAVNVEPWGTQWYRSQVTRADMDLASTTVGDASAGQQPVLDYEARYPDGTPILNMLDDNEIVHADLNAVVTGSTANGYRIGRQAYPEAYWANQNYNQFRERGEEPFREFTVIFHDEIKAIQAFKESFDDPELGHTLHGVRDGFAINYGTGGIGAEILANRAGVGPMGKCVECKYEEFFLSSWAVGDPAMVLDKPTYDWRTGTAALNHDAKVPFPDDPANVHHSYLNDRVKFRNLHAGPKEHHIFHLHAHQWQYDWNEKTSAYLDSQNIGPGGGFTYEIANGGSGNRNKTVGDSIFHCHFYPHFAQGMWELWRVHDTFEQGTILDDDGRPAPGSRAFPDGEITAGTPIPGVIPLPGLPRAPMPNPATTVVAYDLDGKNGVDSSQIDADGNGRADLAERDPVTGEAFAIAQPASNPGYPFFVPGVAGHRAPTPPLDIAIDDETEKPIDGGLARHMIVDGTAVSSQTRLDMNKELTRASVVYLPEDGTPAERTAMAFHAQPDHDGFETNGLPAVPGAPFADPCRPDKRSGWADPLSGASVPLAPLGRKRTYKAAVIELDATLNKLGWHFPQQRILSLNEDVGAALAGTRAPEPLVMRLNVGDCGTYEHTNLVPNTYKLDDYQVKTPTDIIGQHIHLVKFDVLAADGSANGFNYEDGTLSPQEVEERIHAVREQTGTCTNDSDTTTSGRARLDDGETPSPECPLAVKHPTFGSVGDLAWGARTTVQRWYVDPVLNGSWDRGLGTVFSHDHYGPSTHQQVGLYSTVLIEPEESKWYLSRPAPNGSRVEMGSRPDGGPTSWRADIVTEPADNSYREFYLEYSDFQHAYEKGGGVDANGKPVPDFGDVVNPSFRLEPPSGHKTDLFWFPGMCPGGQPRPCPEAISADDPGTYVVNYRNEPLAARVYDPTAKTQASGPRGDLARAFESRTDRKWSVLNTQPGPYAPLTPDVQPGDPYTPLLPVYQGDRVRLRVQVGGQEEEHNFTLHGLRWQHEPRNLNSGWRAGGPTGISEYFNLEMPVVPDLTTGQSNKNVDYLWEAGAQTEDRWNGIWGLMRSYGKARADLATLPNNPIPASGWTVSNLSEFTQSCPKKTNGVQTPTRRYAVTAVRAERVLGADGLVYNSRAGKLVDPNAIIYVMTSSLVRDAEGTITGLTPGTPIEPIVLRAAAGECIRVDLENALPPADTVEDHNGFNALPPIIRKNAVNGGFTTFNNNDIRPSSRVGLVPQLVAHDVRKSGGLEIGISNTTNTVGPGETKQYTWYAGEVESAVVNGKIELRARPVEYGAVNLMAADPIKGASKGLVGALVVEPPGASWTLDPGTRVSATVQYPVGASTRSFREFVTVLQDDVNMRKGGCTSDWSACAIPNVAGEGQGFPEDPQDSGQKAINYGAEPLWHRLGIAADTPFESDALLGSTNVHRSFSNGLVDGDDPQTAVFAASPEQGPAPIRIRLVQPGGHARGHEFTVHGHAWQRQPYIDDSQRLNTGFHDDPTDLGGAMTDHNMTSWWTSSQEGMGPAVHYDLLLKERGGEFTTPGDYLFRDFGSFGTFQGLWGILRVNATPAMARVDSYVSPPRSVATDPGLTVGASSGVKANDLDLDRDPLPPANVVTGPAHGSLALADDGSFTYKPDLQFVGTDRFTYRLGGSGGALAVVLIGIRSLPPSAANDYVAVAAGSSAAIIPVLANDTDPDDTIELVLTDDGESVQVERVKGTSAKGYVTPYGAAGVLYTPFAGATGSDSFKYAIEDETGNRTTGTVFVTIGSAGEGSTTVSAVVWDRKAARWTIEGTAGTLEDPKTATVTALLGGTKTIGTTPVATTPEGKSWKIGPTGTSPPKSCGDKVTVKSSLGTTVASIPVTCR